MKTSQQQTSDLGAERLTSLQEDSLANLLAQQGSDAERMITVTSGRKCLEPLEKSSPLGLLVKTLLESSAWYSPARRLKWEVSNLSSEKVTVRQYSDNNSSQRPSVKTLSEKATPSNRLLFRLVPSEHPTAETGCGLLPVGMLLQTPTVVMTVEDPKNLRARCEKNGYQNGTMYGSLASQMLYDPRVANLLPTQMTADATMGAVIGENDKYVINKNGVPRKITQHGTNGSVGLARYAIMGMLPTPTAQDFKRRGPNSQQQGLPELVYRMSMDLLPTPRANKVNGCDLHNPNIANRNKGNLEEAVAQMIMLPTPAASDYKGGCTRPNERLQYNNALQNHIHGLRQQQDPTFIGKTSQLNPLFVAEMMGFPLMWTVLPYLSESGDPNQSKDTATP